jgi:hypothetical protein
VEYLVLIPALVFKAMFGTALPAYKALQATTLQATAAQDMFGTGLSCQINCSAISGTSGILSLDSCACIQGYVWNGSACVQSTPSNNTTNSTTSNCSTGYVWNGFACQINCLAISNSNGQISLNSCACIQGYVWNGSACVQSTPSNNTTSNCSTGYVWTGLSCQINCSAISGTSGILSLDSCACIQGFTWNGSTCVQSTPSNNTTNNCSIGYVWTGLNCQIDCLAIRNSNGQSGLNSCYCVSGFVWNGFACQFNCLAINNSNGQSGLNTCTCIQGFTWNGSACVQSTPSNNTTSNCSTGYVWNGFACQINCLAISNSNGQISLNSCACIQGFTWNGSACVQSTPSNTTNSTTSNCSTGYVWNGFACQINCLAISNSNGQISLNSCACIQGYVWNGSACVQSTPSNNTTSNCSTGYVWDWPKLSDQLFSHLRHKWNT